MNMKSNKLTRSFLVILSLTALVACNPDKEGPAPSGAYENGFFIVNEGAYGQSNASISFFNRGTGSVENDVFEAVNNVPLGDVAQFMTVTGGDGFIVVNGSNKVEVVNPATMASITTITGLQMPRYMTVANGKAFITETVAYDQKGQVRSVDLSNYTLGSAIPVGALPEQLVVSNGKVFVANQGTSSNRDSTVTIVDAAGETVIETVTVGNSPKWITKDAAGYIWVLCAGTRVYDANWQLDPNLSKPGSLVKMDTEGNIIQEFDFQSTSVFPSNLTINDAGTKLYYNYAGKTYQLDYSASALNTSALIDHGFYGIGVDPQSNQILGAVGGDFSSNSYVLRYTEEGTFIDTLHVGIGPNGFAFH